jgi:hypothetical protein
VEPTAAPLAPESVAGTETSTGVQPTCTTVGAGSGPTRYRISNLVVPSLIQTFSSALFGMIKEEIEDTEEPVDYYDAIQEGIQRAEKYYKIK